MEGVDRMMMMMMVMMMKVMVMMMVVVVMMVMMKKVMSIGEPHNNHIQAGVPNGGYGQEGGYPI